VSDAANVDLSLDQGADFTLQISWTDTNGNPYEVIHPIRMQARARTKQLELDLYSFEEGAEIPEGIEPTITYSSVSGMIQVVVPATRTATMSAGIYDYDMFVTYRASVYDLSTGAEALSTRKMKLLSGLLEVEGRVTIDV
jgi:hypothetical protein